ncbi:YcdB/YcdC domain-containing protein [Lysinibacillus xylanilyticus]|uniref:YcdB/YcdC domain-containing protein n=1 Tax=Lysinibacillus xylanilyticus TaxID=582475 RepID=UPI0038141380
MHKDKLKERALSIVPLPNHYKLIIEEYSNDERVIFSWANEQQDESLTVELDCTGNLIYLSIEKNDSVSEAGSLSIDEKRSYRTSYFYGRSVSSISRKCRLSIGLGQKLR